jgi:hypothetical protein
LLDQGWSYRSCSGGYFCWSDLFWHSPMRARRSASPLSGDPSFNSAMTGSTRNHAAAPVLSPSWRSTAARSCAYFIARSPFASMTSNAALTRRRLSHEARAPSWCVVGTMETFRFCVLRVSARYLKLPQWAALIAWRACRCMSGSRTEPVALPSTTTVRRGFR